MTAPEAKTQLKALVDPRLHKTTKMLAVSRGTTISALVEALLEQELAGLPIEPPEWAGPIEPQPVEASR